jgi:hypothetical protein
MRGASASRVGSDVERGKLVAARETDSQWPDRIHVVSGFGHEPGQDEGELMIEILQDMPKGSNRHPRVGSPAR